MVKFGFFVWFFDIGVDGFVLVLIIGFDYYCYDEGLYVFVGDKMGEIYYFGD